MFKDVNREHPVRSFGKNKGCFGFGTFLPVTLKCVKDSFSRKGLLFAKRTFEVGAVKPV